MKKLLFLLLLPFFANAQFTNQTVRKTISTGDLTLSPSGDSLYTRAQTRALITGSGVLSVFGRTGAVIPQSGDYSSFYPLLNGTGATGTWGVSITGNAATASNSTQWNGQSLINTTATGSATGIMGYDVANSAYRRFTPNAIKNTIAVSLDDAAMVNPVTAQNITMGNLNAGAGVFSAGVSATSGTFSSAVGASSFNGAATGLTGTAASLNIGGNAATVTNGVYTSGNQTIAGTKTFSSIISGSVNGNAATSTLATNSTLWNNQAIINTTATGAPTEPFGWDAANNSFRRFTWSAFNAGQGLGSNAFTSTAYLPLAGGTLSGVLTINSGTGTTPLTIKAGTSGNWQIGPNTGVGSSDDSFGIYSSTWGTSNSFAPIMAISSSTGDVVFSKNVTANSDSTLKKNIKPLLPVSEALRRIGAYSYDWKSNDEHAIGLIAQEVQKYYPELVKTDEKGILSVNYQNFTSVLLQGWKEHDEEISDLKIQMKVMYGIIALLFLIILFKRK